MGVKIRGGQTSCGPEWPHLARSKAVALTLLCLKIVEDKIKIDIRQLALTAALLCAAFGVQFYLKARRETLAKPISVWVMP